ncbi:hypothetical protein GCM10010326_39550 [Streptomyces xanthochromogenes]|uniref:Secreted protein n=2 Tax=Streptomyces xanthochromogenes TaxID=67384 RepID=A0ABQ3ABY1_9ACTN|nr:hypothetical protein GCM10010326_39550 [Streptomyces xanthochromogenes]
MENMIGLVLLVVLALVICGCVCVVWAERGGPRWVRGVSAVTLFAGQLVRHSHKRRRRGWKGTSGEGD